VIGAQNWDKAFFTVISQDYMRMKISQASSKEKGLVRISTDVAEHLSHAYGTRATRVAQIAQDGYGNRLIDSHPYLEAEIVYVAQEEMATTAVDVIARRLRLAFLDSQASEQCAPRIVDILAETLHWDAKRKKAELEDLKYFLHTMTVGRTDQFNDDVDLQS